MGSVEFYDADLANTLNIESPFFIGKTLQEVNTVINEALFLSGYLGELLEIGTLKGLEDFDLTRIIVRKGLKVSLRFNSF